MSNMKHNGNYELHPYKEIAGYQDHAWRGEEAALKELAERVRTLKKSKKRVTLCFDCYPGVDKDEIAAFAGGLKADLMLDAENCAKSAEELEREFEDYITEDRVFGILCHKKLEDFYDLQKLTTAREELAQIQEGVIVIYGVGAALVEAPDLYVYCSITRWEIQCRYRKGMTNWHMDNSEAPVLAKYKRGFFVEWRLADRYKKARYDQFDYLLETEEKGEPKLVSGEAFRAGLSVFSKEPFRLEPYFDPGVWGGHWMQEKFGLDPSKENFAWSFDGVPEENSINMKFGGVTVKFPAIDVVLYRPAALLGERVHGRFGAEFPIRFDLLDTMGGENLSLQVHPLTEYIQDTFGMHYTQDESYYILDADENEDTFVYLGLKKGVDKEAMAKDLRSAEKGETAFPAETYVNKVPVKKHDHILIPGGTVHCSGKNTMVLEISATPYIFTFKLWDWDRVGLDGIPRPIHVEHGLKNIQWNRDTEYIYDQLVGREETVYETKEADCVRTGLHNREFIDTFRYTVKKEAVISCEDSVHVMNLVEGSCALIESTDGSFTPYELHYAETAIVPAAAGSYRLVAKEGQVKVIVASVRR